MNTIGTLKATGTSKTGPSWRWVWVDGGLALLQTFWNQRGGRRDPPLGAWRSRQAPTKGGPPRASTMGVVPHEGSYQAGPRVLGCWRILRGCPPKNPFPVWAFIKAIAKLIDLAVSISIIVFIYFLITRGQRVLVVITSIVTTTVVISCYSPLPVIAVTLISPNLRSTSTDILIMMWETTGLCQSTPPFLGTSKEGEPI